MTPREKQILVVSAGVIIVIIGYFMCWFAGPNSIVDLQWGPPACNLVAPGNDSQDTTGCPPLEDKLLEWNSVITLAVESVCVAGGGTLRNNDYQVSCSNPPVPWSVEEVLSNPTAIEFMNGCYQVGGIFRAQDNWVGCYCPGNQPFPQPNECSRIITFGAGGLSKSCTGPCIIDGEECIEIEGECICYQEEQESDLCEDQDAQACSQGECPQGEYCAMNIPMTGCECRGIPL
jgi:hypothetical protein